MRVDLYTAMTRLAITERNDKPAWFRGRVLRAPRLEEVRRSVTVTQSARDASDSDMGAIVSGRLSHRSLIGYLSH
jgi:hypothetical protein